MTSDLLLRMWLEMRQEKLNQGIFMRSLGACFVNTCANLLKQMVWGLSWRYNRFPDLSRSKYSTYLLALNLTSSPFSKKNAQDACMMLKFSSLTRKQSVFQKTNPQMVRDGEAFSWSMVGYHQVLAFKESMSCVELELFGGWWGYDVWSETRLRDDWPMLGLV